VGFVGAIDGDGATYIQALKDAVLEVVTKSEVGQSAAWLLSTLLEDV
jgi:hypothetical protein